MTAEDPNIPNVQIDTDNLFREDTFTDLSVGTIRRLTPVKPDGSDDDARSVKFVGQTHLMTDRGPMPLDFPIDAKGLKEATENFPDAVRASVASMVEEMKELQRQEASRIVVPGGKGGPGNLIV